MTKVFYGDSSGCLHFQLMPDPTGSHSPEASPWPTPPRSAFRWNDHLPPPSLHPGLDDTPQNLPLIYDPTHCEYLVGEQLPYHHIRSLGHGAYAMVDEVWDMRINRSFARKVIRMPHAYPGTFRDRIWNEIAIIKRLTSIRHFVQVVETYSQGRQFGIIMTPVAEMNLEQYLERNTKPDVEDPMYGWFGCLAAGLRYLHEQKIRHRDIKPANILISNGSILYADFGIAKDVTDEATTSTTGYVDAKSPMYCAPEVALESRRGRVSDVFSLGCVFLEMITTLAWFRGVSLHKFINFRTTNGKNAYHLNTQKNLQWLLNLFGLCGTSRTDKDSSSRGTVMRYTGGLHVPLCFPLEWCYAMLQPSPDNRTTSSNLTTLIESVNRWQDEQRSSHYMAHEALNFTKSPGFTGPCCSPRRLVGKACSGPTLLQTWPTMLSSVVLDPSFSWSWEYANQELGYNPVPPIVRAFDLGEDGREHVKETLPSSPLRFETFSRPTTPYLFPGDPVYPPTGNYGWQTATENPQVTHSYNYQNYQPYDRANAHPDYAQPNYAQPDYTQPNYAQPDYAQPNYAHAQPNYAHAQPNYTQPNYTQPNYAQPDAVPLQPSYPHPYTHSYVGTSYMPEEPSSYRHNNSTRPS
jgi:serine/threonine protein kinase